MVNRIGDRLEYRRRDYAPAYRHCGLNAPHVRQWLVFDIDRPQGFFAAEDALLPEPTFTAINTQNGHSHVGYLLESPVYTSENAREGPLRLLQTVERGFRRRLRADAAYSGFLAKSPWHHSWLTAWQSGTHRLDEMVDCLDKRDKAFEINPETDTAVGRNCTVFATLRKFAYKQVLKFKKDGKTIDDFYDCLHSMAKEVNATFPVRLSYAEMTGIVKSVGKWVWRRFTLEKFSAIQAARAGKRIYAPKLEPWKDLGLSESTYWRRKRAGTIPVTPVYPDMASTVTSV